MATKSQKGTVEKMSKFDEIARLEQQRRELSERIEQQRSGALLEIIATATENAGKIGVSVDELIEALASSTKPAKTAQGKGSVEQKYRNPKNHAETWSGRGKQPQWVRDAIAGGASLDSFSIKPVTATKQEPKAET